MNPFTYSRVADTESALKEKAAGPSVRFLAGGTNLIDLARYGVEKPERLIDINHLPLNKIEPLPGGGLRIGALVRNSDCAADERIRKDYPALSEALHAGASPQL